MTTYYRIIAESMLHNPEAWSSIWTVVMFTAGLGLGWWHFGSAGMAVISGMLATVVVPLMVLVVWYVAVKVRGEAP